MTPSELLDEILNSVSQTLDKPIISDASQREKVQVICQNVRNKAPIRVLLACSLAKIHNPNVDIRKPYTEIGDDDVFSGRAYDENYVGPFVLKHRLPVNATTAFLTPALRNRDTVLVTTLDLQGRPKEVYSAMLELLDDVFQSRLTATELLSELIRQLVFERDTAKSRMESLLVGMRPADDTRLSSERIVSLINQHMMSKNSSRLPVLVVAAAYKAVEQLIKEHAGRLEAHNAADSQTEALGDVQIMLEADDTLVTCYEVKMRPVTESDITHAVLKLSKSPKRSENYIFVTTDRIDPDISDFARTFYDQIGIEIVILDCIGFVRHFLHLFHRHRIQFLDAYQSLVLAEPDSAVSQPLKELFLVLRRTAEAE